MFSGLVARLTLESRVFPLPGTGETIIRSDEKSSKEGITSGRSVERGIYIYMARPRGLTLCSIVYGVTDLTPVSLLCL
jgi:hypothetical protein